MSRVPCSGLDVYATEHIGAVLFERGPVRMPTRSVEKTVVDDEPCDGADDSNAIAGEVDNTSRNNRIIPVIARNSIVPG